MFKENINKRLLAYIKRQLEVCRILCVRSSNASNIFGEIEINLFFLKVFRFNIQSQSKNV